MRSRLLLSSALPVSKEGTSENSINGRDAEALAAAQLITACRGEISWGSRTEDNSKIDLKLSIDHPFEAGEKLTLHIQVKSGPSYGEVSPKGFILKASALESTQRATHSICLIWVDRTTNQLFWAYIHQNTYPGTREYGAHHGISPAFAFDLNRCMVIKQAKVRGGSGVILASLSGSVKIIRARCESLYNEFGSIKTSMFGEIYVTRLAWRHMFRNGRKRKYKEQSFRVIPYLRMILTQNPSTHVVLDCNYCKNEEWICRTTEHLMVYTEVRASARGKGKPIKVKVFIRVIEEIRFPKNWSSVAMLSQLVQQRSTLKSLYYKET